MILKARVPPHNFETLRAVDDAIVILKNAGVKVALAMGDVDNARNLRWEAGACGGEGHGAVVWCLCVQPRHTQARASVSPAASPRLGALCGGA